MIKHLRCGFTACLSISFFFCCVMAAGVSTSFAEESNDGIAALKEEVEVLRKQSAQYKEANAKLEARLGQLEGKLQVMESEKAQAPLVPVEKRITAIEKKVENLDSRNVSGEGASWADKIKVKGSIWQYFVSSDSGYFTNTSSRFLETTARLGADAHITDKLSADLQIILQNAALDATDYTAVTTDNWDVDVELANITLSGLFERPLSLTVGRQNLGYGDGFLIWDGVSDSRTVWTGSFRSFYAIKGVYASEPFTVDAFAAIVDKDFISYETFLVDAVSYTGDRYLFGGNVHHESEGSSVWDFGVFYKDDGSSLASNTVAISQRGTHTFDFWPDSAILPEIILTGEAVEEFGTTKVKDHALTTTDQDRRSFGGHLDVALSLTDIQYSPYVKGSYIYFPGDNPDTKRNEAFDPMFYGSEDWGTWGIGDIGSFSLSNTNERAIMGEIGFYPTETTALRAQYYYITLDRPLAAAPDMGKKWAHEVNVIYDYYPNDWFFCGAEFGWSDPLKAAEAYAGANNNATEFVVWAGVDF